MPAARHFSRSPMIAPAVIAMIGWCLSRLLRSCLRIRRVASKPSITGICTSISTASKASAVISRTASAPFSASVTWKPWRISSQVASFWLAGWSSTSSTRLARARRSGWFGGGPLDGRGSGSVSRRQGSVK